MDHRGEATGQQQGHEGRDVANREGKEGGRQQNQSSSSSASFDDRYNSFFIDYSLVPLLVQQNFIDASKSGIFRNPQLDDVSKLELLSRSADSVSDMDLVGARIRGSDQHWELLPSQAIFSVKTGFHIQGFQAFPSFPAWLGKYSTTSKRQRLTKEIVHHTCLSIGQGFLPIRLDYIPFLRQALLDPLIKRGKEGATQTVDLLDRYDLSREDFTETLREMQFKSENDKQLVDHFDRLDTQTKTALTKLYNSMSHKSATIVQTIGAKKAKRAMAAGGDEEGLGDEDDGELAEEGGNDDEEEEDLAAIRAEMNKSLIKAKAKKSSKESLTKSKGSAKKL